MNVYIAYPDLNKFISTCTKSTIAKIEKMFRSLRDRGPYLGMPYSKQVSKNLYELRVKGTQEVRIFYCVVNKEIFLVHGFLKKTQKTPAREIKTSIRRIKELT